MTKICLVTALPAESKPLIAHFGLAALATPGLTIYDGEHLCLVETGIGKLPAAVSVAAFLYSSPSICALVNIGLAGADRPIGEVLLAHCVKDQASGKLWYPHLPSRRRLNDADSIEVHTVDTPSTDYTPEHAFDMEASGVFSAATRRLNLDAVHCVKVVSDNATQPWQKFDKQIASDLITQTLPIVDSLTASLLSQPQPSSNQLQELIDTLTTNYHHTATGKHELRKLLQRHQALYGHQPDMETLNALDSAKQIKKHLQHLVSAAPVTY